MKKILLLFSAVAWITLTANAQDTLWRKGGLGSLNLGQVGLTNWAGGGEDAVSANLFVNLFANYAKGKITWDNNLDIAYGLTKQGEQDLRKNDDRLDYSTKFGYRLGDTKWYYTLLAGFKSQFSNGYAYPDDSTVISKFAAPAYIVLSLGMDFKPNENFSLFISPATGKITLVSDQAIADGGAYGNEGAFINDAGEFIKGKKTRVEFGAYLKAMYKRDVMKNVSFSTKIDLFSNYQKNPQNVDVNWEVLIGMKVNNFITATIGTQLIYDHDIQVPLYDKINGMRTVVGAGPRTQFKEVFGIGLSYKFTSYSVK